MNIKEIGWLFRPTLPKAQQIATSKSSPFCEESNKNAIFAALIQGKFPFFPFLFFISVILNYPEGYPTTTKTDQQSVALDYTAQCEQRYLTISKLGPQLEKGQ